MSDLLEKLKKEYDNPMRVPCVVKIVINRGVGEAREDAKACDVSAKELAEITGQKPLVRTAKKSIAVFKIREGMQIGLKVTLRGERMRQFLNKLINICLPKIRDFKGVSPKSFDGRGNYTFGIKEQLVFPEVDYERVDRVRGMDITIVTSAANDNEAKKLLEAWGMPFRKETT
ncbi:50S ribosomal protein L5 [candidate division WOR-1 bacterium RIFCSPLOWO2_02_FULL_46_20]|uniref:Large ribosomal subunit protein uL5 n=2 Tax=Saganbacteria TaxID=1703751 RepID=A0A1F4R744_UNCSA|nr:MAG: 50S ribosomal protein L5 [candidate division WOR-1 bacterium RIFCSPHIGHO2_02_FULL_45_12]OGC03263.1 MAG: 50S ribosomal protein L5 [candidate division WOR-1 bacterium RIFCSPLOWO2_02_FULL_46_20]OGC08909.1 MAG: 50S ribosomal protein L5 [candidate division WOR-1 bacterium RIFCSPLOWO2_12_FULL_45_9]